MIRKITALFFIVLFMGLIVAPTVIVVLDDTIDTSIFSSMTEEEENGKTKKLISPFSLQSNEFTSNLELKDFEHFGYFFKNYPKPHLNLISPPPDFNLI